MKTGLISVSLAAGLLLVAALGGAQTKVDPGLTAYKAELAAAKKEKTDTKDTFRRWKVLGKTAVKDADARKALLAALDKGIADHAEKSRKEVEMGLLVESGCFQPRHALRATSGGNRFAPIAIMR